MASSSSSNAATNSHDMFLSPCIWMGMNFEEDMNEQFIMQAFEHYGEKVLNVKILKGKKTGQSRYCFVEFQDVDRAKQVLHKLNGKPIPNTHPSNSKLFFKLNPASYNKDNQLLPEFSLHIGDLTLDVDDFALYSAFAKNYKSVRGAKEVFTNAKMIMFMPDEVVLDNTGTSKGFGFVRFSEELDQHRALMEMQHMTGIGQRQIKVGLAGPKRGWAMSTTVYKNQSEDYGGSYSQAPYPGSSGYYTWGGYYPYGPHHASHQPPAHKYLGETQAATSEDLEVLEDPCLEINVTKENREFMESSETFFEALDRSRWFAIDGVQSEIPA